jgi:pimeloyl-ACP methyl ester carboxylesterase
METKILTPCSQALAACAVLALLALPVAAQPTQEEIEERLQLASTTTPLISIDADKAATGPQLAAALDVPAALITSATVSGPAAGTAVFSSLGVIQPKQGTSLGVLSSGIAGTSSPEPGTDFSPGGTAGDSVTLTLVLDVPEGSTRLAFDYNFLSAEFPDFIGSAFNDTFRADVSDANGSRTVALASVNSSFFFAASGSRAGGSGFDIFTEDPSGVDTSFGGGLPDAGLTDWQSVNVPIAGGGPLTLTFNVRDLGDGILDSAVVIDNVVITSLEAVDPNPDLLDGDEVSSDPEDLAAGGAPVGGAAADGVTRVLLRTAVGSSGSVEFSIDGNAPEDGGVGTVGSGDRLSTVTVPVEETAEGFQAFAVYLVPEEFNRGGDEGLADRPLTFHARFVPDAGDPVESELPFRIVRPPVVLIHGLWSSAATWTFPLASDGRFSTTIADYEQTNASLFSTNLQVPFTFIQEGLARLRNQGIAATQADLGGHSMGGILSRNHIRRPNYRRPQNYDEGDVHKLVTLNTPHTGSPLANVLVFIRDALPDFLGEPLVEKLRDAGFALDEGAVDNLQKGSGAILSIPQTRVPSHALVGIGGSDLLTDGLALVPGKIGILFKIIDFIDENTDVFAGIQHDAIVGRRSQEGGISTSAITVFDGLESVHTFVTGSANYSNRVIELYNTDADSAEFAEFPATITVPLTATPAKAAKALAAPDKAGLLIPGGLTITAPAAGTTVLSGGSVPVTVATANGFVLDRLLLVTEVDAQRADDAPFAAALEIPLDAIGPIELVAFGRDANGDYAISDPVSLTVVPAADLEQVFVVNRDPILAAGSTRHLSVLGSYDDGVLRDISDGATGTQYLTSSSFIVSVSADGVLTANNQGIATVVARNSGIQDSISVTVVEASDTTPPAIASVAADPDVLWPPNHKMVAVTIAVEVSDDSDPDPVCAISGVTANEPIDGDFAITGPLTVDLRAERLGSGVGRVYTVAVECSDASGNVASAGADVLVPHDQGQ